MILVLFLFVGKSCIFWQSWNLFKDFLVLSQICCNYLLIYSFSLGEFFEAQNLGCVKNDFFHV